MVCAVSWPGRLRCGNRETFVRFWTIPGPGEPGSGSWPGQLYLRGGGTTWMPDEKFLSAVPFVQQLNWAKSIDAQGRPVLTGIKPTARGTLICPVFPEPRIGIPRPTIRTHIFSIFLRSRIAEHLF